jgi:hypothetical protein
MKLSIMSAILSAATIASARINLGTDGTGNTIAWKQGSNPCNYVFVSPPDVNICGYKFTIDGSTYYVSGLAIRYPICATAADELVDGLLWN